MNRIQAVIDLDILFAEKINTRVDYFIITEIHLAECLKKYCESINTDGFTFNIRYKLKDGYLYAPLYVVYENGIPIQCKETDVVKAIF